MHRKTRNVLVILSMFVILVTFYALKIEPNLLVVKSENINDETGKKIRLMQISDLHIKKIRRVHHRIIEAINEYDPEIIVITGDAVDKGESLPILSQFLAMIPKDITIFAIIGNWEYWTNLPADSIREFYSRHNVQLLINETACYVYCGDTLLISGLDDQVAGLPSLSESLKGISPQSNHILLAHSPDDYILKEKQILTTLKSLKSNIEIDSFHINATLSGHTHGGQVTLLGKVLFTPPGSNGYVSGWYNKDENPIYISKGVGSSVLPIRFMAKPEITLFNWYLKS